jgi:SET domain-containing protein
MSRKSAAPVSNKRQIPEVNSEFTAYRLRVGPSEIHRWGVYAVESIPARRKVIEYTGERISRRETKKRSERELNYLFTLDSYWTIDGSVNGSGAQYINHCCEPNLAARIVRGHILYLAVRDIRAGEELTVDYHFYADVEKVPCACGSLKCRGTINIKD